MARKMAAGTCWFTRFMHILDLSSRIHAKCLAGAGVRLYTIVTAVWMLGWLPHDQALGPVRICVHHSPHKISSQSIILPVHRYCHGKTQWHDIMCTYPTECTGKFNIFGLHSMSVLLFAMEKNNGCCVRVFKLAGLSAKQQMSTLIYM